jgi:hypothetical protein
MLVNINTFRNRLNSQPGLIVLLHLVWNLGNNNVLPI